MLKQCGDDLTRENIMKQAANLKDFRIEMLLPGIKINTSPTDFAPISPLQLMKFKGERWEPVRRRHQRGRRRLTAVPCRYDPLQDPPQPACGGFLLPQTDG